VVWIEVPPVLVVLALMVWTEVDVEWVWIGGMEEAVGDAGYGIGLVTQVVDSGWNFAP